MRKQKTGTREWAQTTVNIQRGCEHNCRYCYAREMAVRFKQCTAERWSQPVIQPAKVHLKKYRKRKGVVMFPSTHDITPRNINECLVVLGKLLEAGNHVLIVSKPSKSCVRTLCDTFFGYRDQIVLRFTIGSVNDSVLGFWEPGAPGFLERKESLEDAWYSGFETSLSVEPYLDDQVEYLYECLVPYITQHFWIGKLRRLNKRVNMMQLTSAQICDYVQPLQSAQTNEAVMELYRRLNGKPHVRWKDSIRVVAAGSSPKT